MNLREYLAATHETAHYAGVGTSVGALYCYAGLVEERAELQAASVLHFLGWPNSSINVINEAGDMLWYAVRLSEDSGVVEAVLGGYLWDFAQVQAREAYQHDPMRLNSLAREVKRLHRDGVGLNPDALRTTLEELCWVVETAGSTLEEVAIANVKKLRDRKARGVISGAGDDR